MPGIHAPGSLARRLSVAAAGLIVIAMVLATIALGFILQRFIQGQIDGRLDGQIVFLQSLLRVPPDGTLSLSGDADGPPFDRPGHGWYWQVAGARTVLRSRALGNRDLLEAVKPPPPPHEDPEGRLRPRPAAALSHPRFADACRPRDDRGIIPACGGAGPAA